MKMFRSKQRDRFFPENGSHKLGHQTKMGRTFFLVVALSCLVRADSSSSLLPVADTSSELSDSSFTQEDTIDGEESLKKKKNQHHKKHHHHKSHGTSSPVPTSSPTHAPSALPSEVSA